MKLINKITSITFILLLSALFAVAQIPSNATQANIGITDINLASGGNMINQTANMVFSIANGSSSPCCGNIPVNAINAQVSFPSQFGLQDGTLAALTSQLASQGWSVEYVEFGPSGTIIVSNMQAMGQLDALPLTLPVVGFQVGGGTVSITLERNLPFIAGEQDPTDNIMPNSFTVAQPLSVKLESFTATRQGQTALLEWATVSEQNNKGFGIERSTDGRVWTNIGFVKSQCDNGNSNFKLSYNFTDEAPLNGQSYYRLKQTDRDGKYEYSQVRMLKFDGEKSILLYPNPAKDQVNIIGLQGDEQIAVYDVTGRLMVSQKTEGATVSVGLGNLDDGVYQIKVIEQDGSTSGYKVIKSK